MRPPRILDMRLRERAHKRDQRFRDDDPEADGADPAEAWRPQASVDGAREERLAAKGRLREFFLEHGIAALEAVDRDDMLELDAFTARLAQSFLLLLDAGPRRPVADPGTVWQGFLALTGSDERDWDQVARSAAAAALSAGRFETLRLFRERLGINLPFDAFRREIAQGYALVLETELRRPQGRLAARLAEMEAISGVAPDWSAPAARDRVERILRSKDSWQPDRSIPRKIWEVTGIRPLVSPAFVAELVAGCLARRGPHSQDALAEIAELTGVGIAEGSWRTAAEQDVLEAARLVEAEPSKIPERFEQAERDVRRAGSHLSGERIRALAEAATDAVRQDFIDGSYRSLPAWSLEDWMRRCEELFGLPIVLEDEGLRRAVGETLAANRFAVAAADAEERIRATIQIEARLRIDAMAELGAARRLEFASARLREAMHGFAEGAQETRFARMPELSAFARRWSAAVRLACAPAAGEGALPEAAVAKFVETLGAGAKVLFDATLRTLDAASASRDVPAEALLAPFHWKRACKQAGVRFGLERVELHRWVDALAAGLGLVFPYEALCSAFSDESNGRIFTSAILDRANDGLHEGVLRLADRGPGEPVPSFEDADPSTLSRVVAYLVLESSALVRWHGPELTRWVGGLSEARYPFVPKMFDEALADFITSHELWKRALDPLRLRTFCRLRGAGLFEVGPWKAALSGKGERPGVRLRYALGGYHAFVVSLGVDDPAAAGHESVRRLLEEEANRLYAAGDFDPDEDFIELLLLGGMRLRPDVVRERVLREAGRNPEAFELAMMIAKRFGVRLEFPPESFSKIVSGDGVSPRALALLYDRALPSERRAEAVRAVREGSPLGAILPQLLAIQGPAGRAKFCPYRNGLGPLLAQREHPIDLALPGDREGLLSFAHRFGLLNLPVLARTVIGLRSRMLDDKAGKRLDDAGARDRYVEAFERFFALGRPVAGLEEAFRRIDGYWESIRAALQADEPLPAGIEGDPLGMELFNALVSGGGTYHSAPLRPQLIAAARVHADQLRLPSWAVPGIEPVLLRDGTDDYSDGAEAGIRRLEAEAAKIRAGQPLRDFLAPWERAERQLRLQEDGRAWGFWFLGVAALVRSSIDVLEAKLLDPKAAAGAAGIRMRIEGRREALAKLEVAARRVPAEGDRPLDLLAVLRGAFVADDGRFRREDFYDLGIDAARGLFLAEMFRHTPGYRALLAAEDGGATDAWIAFFQREYLEHYGAPPKGTLPRVPEGLVPLMHLLWRTNGIARGLREEADPKRRPRHPVADAGAALEAISEKVRRLEIGDVPLSPGEVSFCPVMGLGRVFAGDVADACYVVEAEGLARGQYPRLSAVLIALPGQQAFAGSFLLIDATTSVGEGVLVIRALNPSEAVIRRRLDPKTFLEAVIRYARSLVRRSGGYFTEIRICIDPCGGHSTNRTDIFRAEAAMVAAEDWRVPYEDLIRTPETSFNRYDIAAASATRLVPLE